MLIPYQSLACGGLTAFICMTLSMRASGESIDFSKQILPILSDKCFICHGPDARNDKDIRLDSREEAIRDLGGYRALDPDQPEKSEILSRIRDQDDPMPPEDADNQLSENEKVLLEQWIAQGGEYDTHWAFKKPVRDQDWVDRLRNLHPNPIDAFIAEGLSDNETEFAVEAEKPTLARRAALTLTGLPPEPSDLALFMADDAEEAFERWLDQLFSNPKYGEHQARFWLDAIRYGDTHGLHLDNRRGIYPFRDWVVRALNSNQPFDEFITWQMAGDLLPDPTLDQQLATGFVRMNPTTSEGGVIPAEFQAKNNFDRVETFGTVFLGMSMVCARCHTHKYDPVTQKEYYELMSFFNSTAENPLDGNAYIYGPTLRVPDNQFAWDEWMNIKADRDQLLGHLDAVEIQNKIGEIDQRGDWEADEWKITRNIPTGSPIPTEEAFENLKGNKNGFKKGTVSYRDEAAWVSFKISSPVRQTLWLTFSGGPDSVAYLDGNPIAPFRNALADQRFVSLPLVMNEGDQIILLKMAGTEVSVQKEVKLQSPWNQWKDKQDWLSLAPGARVQLLADVTGPLAGLNSWGAAESLARKAAMAESNFTTTLVAKDLPEPRVTKVLHRGEYSEPTGDALSPGVLSVMGNLPEGAPNNRLGLAKWLTSPDHPVVARVLINQVWQRVFGVGLVRTPEDFGLQGQQPTHPELLDWLAIEFQESGWDLKHMIRLMMTSRTYKQDSAWRSELNDPENRLFARGPSYRLDAEVIRDMGLWAANILDPHMGGEGVKPYQPGGMWQALAHPASNTKLYEADRSLRAYRRSLYVYWKRTSPHPMMTLFDAPSRETSCVRRSRTNTSLQSLGLLNESQRIEMARFLAERLLKERFRDRERIDYLFTLIASRPASSNELSACQELVDTMRKRYQAEPKDADSLLSYGQLENTSQLPKIEHAAWTQLTATVLASDASILLY
ncbi:PSD1 and planctomycete cytochrome C domain-containing protein [Verrucomicrobia bacterium]|nr:PSD1 and planctomycete cytochrome C domain-containing protein [Verrucomicrobiota bacterium]MDA7627095.1 PSD1 and planctomycete cytochrome C domain-containing protein [Verrucomicrobiota bacterium]MDA7669460.1 PSD1 and planctomycete cytochrome C domain-containing protein [bacterium]